MDDKRTFGYFHLRLCLFLYPIIFIGLYFLLKEIILYPVNQDIIIIPVVFATYVVSIILIWKKEKRAYGFGDLPMWLTCQRKGHKWVKNPYHSIAHGHVGPIEWKCTRCNQEAVHSQVGFIRKKKI